MKKQVIGMVLASLLFSVETMAAEPSLTRGTYYVDFMGIPLAKLWAQMREADGRYELHSTLKSRGLMRLFSKIKAETQSEGMLRDGVPRTEWITVRYRTKDAHTELRFDAAGELAHRVVHPEDNPSWRPPVPVDQLRDAYTFGDILFGLRSAMARFDAANPAPLHFRLYDGKRLIQMTFEPKGEAVLSHDGQSVSTQQFSVSRRYLGGFTPKEQKRMEEGEPAAQLYLRSSDGFPLKFTLDLAVGRLTGHWDGGRVVE